MECTHGIGSVMTWKLGCHPRESDLDSNPRRRLAVTTPRLATLFPPEQGPSDVHVATRLPAFKESR